MRKIDQYIDYNTGYFKVEYDYEMGWYTANVNLWDLLRWHNHHKDLQESSTFFNMVLLPNELVEEFKEAKQRFIDAQNKIKQFYKQSKGDVQEDSKCQLL